MGSNKEEETDLTPEGEGKGKGEQVDADKPWVRPWRTLTLLEIISPPPRWRLPKHAMREDSFLQGVMHHVPS